MSPKRSLEFFTPDTTEESSSCYSIHMNTPSSSFMANSQHQLYRKDSPLTLENVSRIQSADPSGTPLARYCYELGSSNNTTTYYSDSTTTMYSADRRRKRNLTRQSRDNVLESPRILPFPYHNDSFFLPTAEHDYPGRGGQLDANSSTVSLHTYESQTASISRPSTSSYHRRQQQQQQQYYCYNNKNDPHPQKRSRPSCMQVTPEWVTIIPDVAVSQKKHLLKDTASAAAATKFNFNFKIDSLLLAKAFGFQHKYKESKKNVPWFEKIKRLFKKEGKGASTSGPVWHNKFNCNPTPTTLLT